MSESCTSNPAPTPTTTLTTFAESGLRAIFTTTSPPAFSLAFDAFFSRFLEATLNGKTLSRAELKQALLDVQRSARSAKVEVAGVVQAPKSAEAPEAAGIVGLFLTAVFATGGEHMLTQERVTASYKLTIAPGPLFEPAAVVGDVPAPEPEAIERRRVSAVDVVMAVESVS